jgi:Uncharacterized conserved protein (DUF2285)
LLNCRTIKPRRHIATIDIIARLFHIDDADHVAAGKIRASRDQHERGIPDFLLSFNLASGRRTEPLRDPSMKKPPLDPDVADTAPSDSVLTIYDEEHIITYLRLLDADAEGADWREVARIVLHLDPECEPERARRAFERHLWRAKWMTEQHGYRLLLRGGASA